MTIIRDCFSRIIVIYLKIWPELARTCNLSTVQNQLLRVPIQNAREWVSSVKFIFDSKTTIHLWVDLRFSAWLRGTNTKWREAQKLVKKTREGRLLKSKRRQNWKQASSSLVFGMLIIQFSFTLACQGRFLHTGGLI